MQIVSRNTAIALTPSPRWIKADVQPGAITSDIMQAVVKRYDLRKEDTRRLASRFKGMSLSSTLQQIFYFTKSHVKYVVDPAGWQFIKRPSVILRHGYGDCKSYSILMGSILYNLGIPFEFRFVSYDPDQVIRHVYLIVKQGKNAFPLDPCLDYPFQEKSGITKKIDMTQIVHIDGIGATSDRPAFKTVADALDTIPIEQLDEATLALLAERERIELERAILLRSGGIAAVGADQYDQALAAIDDALRADRQSQLEKIALAYENGMYNQSGISAISREQNLGFVISGNSGGGFFRKVGRWIGNGAKAVTNVLTAPAKAAATLILKVLLPKAAGFFLYLFAPAASLPAKAQQKRAIAERLKRFIVDVLGMREDTFTKLIRNGIMKQTGRTPEQLIASFKSGVSGAIGAAWVAAAVQAVVSIIQQISKHFKKQAGDLSNISIKEGPSESDFKVLTPGYQTGSGGKVLQPGGERQTSGGNTGLLIGAAAVAALLLLRK